MTGKLAIAAAGALIALAAAAPAHADHVTAAAGVTLEPGARTAAGARRAVVSWNLTCAPEEVAPEDVEVGMHLRDRRGRTRLFSDLAPRGQGALPPQGRAEVVLPAGGEFVARASLACSGEHRAEAQAESGAVRTKPWINSYEFPTHELCGYSPRGHENDLQAGIPTTLNMTATFFPALWMKRPGSSGELRVRFRGGGLPRSVRPYDSDWRGGRNQIVVSVHPKRGGRALTWLEIGGVPTSNKLPIRVLPRKRGC